MLYTAQYRYSGQDRLDITVKGNDPAGKLYAPTWDMVKRVKAGTMSEMEYTDAYYALLLERWANGGSDEMMRLVHMVNGAPVGHFGDFGEFHLEDVIPPRDVTLVCFCPAGTFCHRHLLAAFFNHNFDVPLGGERR